MCPTQAQEQAETSGREYPQRPFVSVHGVILQGDRVLLVKRAREPSQGRWSLPGGAVKLGETIRRAAQREVREECGIEVEVDGVVDVADNIILDDNERIQFHYVVVSLLARYVGGEASPGSDASELAWVLREELDALNMHPRARETAHRSFEIAATTD